MITKQDFYTFNGYVSEEDFIAKTDCYVASVFSPDRVLLKHIDPFISAHKRMAIAQYKDTAKIAYHIANITKNTRAMLEHKELAYDVFKTSLSNCFNIPKEYIKNEDIILSSDYKGLEFLGHRLEYNSNVSKKQVQLNCDICFWTTWKYIFEMVDKVTKFKLERSDCKY
jgi:hypothetical protein